MKILLLLFAFCLIVPFVKAQLNSSYLIGSIGAINGKSINSSPIQVSGNNCIQVTTGLNVFMPSKQGAFFDECAVSLNYIKLSIQIAPNPVESFTIIRLKSKISNSGTFKVIVMDEMGTLENAYLISQDLLLNNGFRLNMSTYKTGVHFVNLSAEKVYESFKIFKL